MYHAHYPTLDGAPNVGSLRKTAAPVLAIAPDPPATRTDAPRSTFQRVHADNPYLHLLTGLRPLFDVGDYRTTRDVFSWTHARERIDIERAALAAVKPAFEAERAEHERQIEIHRRRMAEAMYSPTLQAVHQKYIKQHTEAIKAMNLQSRLDMAALRIASAEKALGEVERWFARGAGLMAAA